MSVNSKMTALADEIRELSGTTTTKSIDAMTSDVGAANTEISEQMDLIAQITTALEGKAAGGSGGGNVEACTARVRSITDIYFLKGWTWNDYLNSRFNGYITDYDGQFCQIFNASFSGDVRTEDDYVVCSDSAGTIPVQLTDLIEADKIYETYWDD